MLILFCHYVVFTAFIVPTVHYMYGYFDLHYMPGHFDLLYIAGIFVVTYFFKRKII